MFKLLASYDCGASYQKEAEAETLNELAERAREFESQGLRWCIEDEHEEVVDISNFLKSLVAQLAKRKNNEVNVPLLQAIERTLYHYPDVTPAMVTMILNKDFAVAPPLPTEDEKARATELVKQLIQRYKTAFREAVLEVTGEEVDDW